MTTRTTGALESAFIRSTRFHQVDADAINGLIGCDGEITIQAVEAGGTVSRLLTFRPFAPLHKPLRISDCRCRFRPWDGSHTMFVTTDDCLYRFRITSECGYFCDGEANIHENV